MNASFEKDDEVAVYATEAQANDPDTDPAYTGTLEDFVDDAVALVMGPAGPADPSGLREVQLSRMEVC